MFSQKAFDDAIRWAVFVLISIGFVLGWFVFSAIPWLWEILKPYLHSLTA